MSERKVINLYEHFKNSPKKLKIVCDWDEVIQACEPYAEYLRIVERDKKSEVKGYSSLSFPTYFEQFWKSIIGISLIFEYSPYGSKLISNSKEVEVKQIQIKNSPNFYQEAPFLTIAEDLLKLIKEDKIDRLIFLSAYDKRKFPNGDERKVNIVWNTFGMTDIAEEKQKKVSIKLIPFDSETQGQTKADWIKQNASDFDIVIDDNPNICKELAFLLYTVNGKIVNRDRSKINVKNLNFDMKVLAPHYPAIEDQHHSEVLLVKNEVSDLKVGDFSKYE